MSSKCLPPQALRVGDRISYQMNGSPQIGWIRWIGVLPEEITSAQRRKSSSFDPSSPSSSLSSSSSSAAATLLYAGVEFRNPVGNGTGAVKVIPKRDGDGRNTIQYFQCRKNHAGFVKLSSLTKIESEAKRRHHDSGGSSIVSSVGASGGSIGSSVGSIGSFSRLSISTSHKDDFDDDIFESDDEMENLLSEVASTKLGNSSVKSPSGPSVSRIASTHPIFGANPSTDSEPTRPIQKKKFCPVLAISKCESKPAKPSTSLTLPTSPPSSSVSAYLPSSNFPSNYKSAICSYWQQTGRCPTEDDCNFAHGNDERRYWDAQLRKGRSIAPRGRASTLGEDDDDNDVNNNNGDARVTRVKKTYRSDGQFSSNAFAKDKADVRKGGRILTSMTKKK